MIRAVLRSVNIDTPFEATTLAKCVKDYFEPECDTRVRKREDEGPELKLDAHIRKFVRGERSGARVRGDEHLRDLKMYLDSFGMERTVSQRRFHEAFLCATLPHIYGSGDFERHRTRILKENKIDKPVYEVLIVTPRRWGKTTSVAMFVAALLLSTADMWISVFSTGQRASSSLLEAVYKMVCAVPDGSSRILRRNQEQLYIKGTDPGDVRRMFSYPSSVQGTFDRAVAFVFCEITVGSIFVRRLSIWSDRFYV